MVWSPAHASVRAPCARQFIFSYPAQAVRRENRRSPGFPHDIPRDRLFTFRSSPLYSPVLLRQFDWGKAEAARSVSPVLLRQFDGRNQSASHWDWEQADVW